MGLRFIMITLLPPQTSSLQRAKRDSLSRGYEGQDSMEAEQLLLTPSPSESRVVINMDARHRELLRLKLAGVDNKECGRLLDMSGTQVGMIVKSPIFVNTLAGMQREADSRAYDVVDHMKRAAQEAAETITEVMRDAPQYGVKLSAAKTVLALAGHNVSGQPSVTQNTQYNLSFEQRMRQFDTPSSGEVGCLSSVGTE